MASFSINAVGIPPCISIQNGALRGYRIQRSREAVEVTTFNDAGPVYIDGRLHVRMEIEVYAMDSGYPVVDVARAWLVSESFTAGSSMVATLVQEWEFEEMPDAELHALLGMPQAKKVEAPEVIRRKIRAMDLG